jgi:hypothetical protein
MAESAVPFGTAGAHRRRRSSTSPLRAPTQRRPPTNTQRVPEPEIVSPVRRALAFLVARGTASFAVAVLAVVPIAADIDGPLHQLGHALLPSLLGVVVVARAAHVALARTRASRRGAWSRARAIDPGETLLAAVTALVVPVAWLAGAAVIFVHHLGDPPPTPGAIVALYLPLFLGLWVLATIAWLGDCAERLGGALDESDRMLRAYWRGVAGARDG